MCDNAKEEAKSSSHVNGKMKNSENTLSVEQEKSTINCTNENVTVDRNRTTVDESFKNTMCGLEHLLDELKSMNTVMEEKEDKKEVENKKKKENNGNVVTKNISITLQKNDDIISKYGDVISKIDNVKANNDVILQSGLSGPSLQDEESVLLVYQRIVLDLKTEVECLRELNSASNTVLQKEILSLKEDLRVKNNYIKDHLNTRDVLCKSSTSSRGKLKSRQMKSYCY